ncbi:hypothetical protein HYS31_04680 [Candidatus Woesearchaeota archaeon]|nr:hypothetical protein [Candidatus Woesearchaeota archaeon]
MTYEEHEIMKLLGKTDTERYNQLMDLKNHDPEEYKKQMEILKFESKSEPEDNLSKITNDALIGKGDILDDFKEVMPDILESDGIYYSNSLLPYENIKKAIKNIYETHQKAAFIISKSITIKGKILNTKYKHKENISLLKIGKRTNKQGIEEFEIFFIGDRADYRHWRIIDEICGHFFIYELIYNRKKYLIFSEEELSSEEYFIEGILIENDDLGDIGHHTKISLKLPLIFVNKAKPRIIKYQNHDELFKDVKNMSLTKDKLFSFIYSRTDGNSYRHPSYFEELDAAFLFSAKYGDKPYSLHRLDIARQGAGKTFRIEAIHEKMDETQDIVDGSGSTLKVLIPSFKNIQAEQGALIKSNRVCCVDEFLRILCRIPKEDREPQLGALNPLLEHSVREFGSGNCSLVGSMKSKLLAVSNDIYGTKTMPELCERIDNPFLSRLLVWYLDKKHIKFIEKGEGKEETKLKIDKDKWLSIYDYMQTFRASYDNENVNEVYNRYTETDILPEKVRDVYTARYKHHINCLIDGLIKTRCLCEPDPSFAAKEEDYRLLELMWGTMLRNWIDVKKQELDEMAKKQLLTQSQRYILEIMQQNGNKIQVNHVQDLDCNNPVFQIEGLCELGLVYRDGSYYRIQESIKEVVEVVQN